MKKENLRTRFIDSLKPTRFLILLTISVSAIFFSGCCSPKLAVYGGMKGSEPGGGIVLGCVEYPVGENLKIGGIAGYSRYWFDNGYDNLFNVGIQGRNYVERSPFWFGGELGYIRAATVYQDSTGDNDPAANGYNFGGLLGYKLPVRSIDLNAFTGVSMIHFNDFKYEGYISGPGHNVVQIRVGLEVTLPFSK